MFSLLFPFSLGDSLSHETINGCLYVVCWRTCVVFKYISINTKSNYYFHSLFQLRRRKLRQPGIPYFSFKDIISIRLIVCLSVMLTIPKCINLAFFYCASKVLFQKVSINWIQSFCVLCPVKSSFSAQSPGDRFLKIGEQDFMEKVSGGGGGCGFMHRI